MNYEPLIFDALGLNLDSQVIGLDETVFTKLDNWSMGQDNSSVNRLGILTKLNASDSTFISALPVSGRVRGLYEFFPSSSKSQLSYIYAPIITAEYTALAIYFHQFIGGVSTWKTLTNSSAVDLDLSTSHFTFANRYDSWRGVDTVYLANGGSFYKHFNDNINSIFALSQVASRMSDVGGTAVDATTASGNVTWTQNSNTVTIAADTFVSAIQKGSWVRESSTAQWYEVAERVSTTELTLRSIFYETTATSATAQYAPYFDEYPKYVIHWRDMLVAANFSTGFTGVPSSWGYIDGASSGLILTTGGDTLVWSEEDINDSGMVMFTDFLTEATPAALETWSGSNAGGSLTTLMHGITNITAIYGLSDYFYIFGENEYVVFKFNADLLPPVSEVNRKRKGCNSFDTIKAVDDTIIYFTGTEVRQTNGFSDISISEDIDNDIKNKCYVQPNWKYFSDTATDNNYPTAFYDSFNNQYHLYLTSKDDVTVRYDYCYDLTKKKWIAGRLNSQNVSRKIESYSLYAQTEMMADRRSYYFPASATDTMLMCYVQSGRSAMQTQGEIQSGDMFMNNIVNKGQLKQIEFWIHVGVSTSVTFDFNYFIDNTQILSTALQFTVSNTSATDKDYIKKVNIPISGEGLNFRWNLKDTAWSGNSAISLVGGYYGKEPLKKEK